MELYQDHKELKNQKSEQSKSHDLIKKDQKDLEELERKNKLLERDVKRYQNRQELLQHIKHITYKKYWAVSVRGRESVCMCVCHRDVLNLCKFLSFTKYHEMCV